MTRKAKEIAAAEANISAEGEAGKAVAVIPESEPESIPEPIRIPSSSGPTFGQRVRSLFSFLFRLLLILIVLSVIGVGLYFGLPLVYQKYILPVEENTSQLRQLRSQQVQNEQTIIELQNRLSAIETQQAQQAQSLTDLDTRVSGIETEIAAHTETLAALEKMQETLQAQQDAANADLGRQINVLKSMELLSRARLYLYQSNFGLAKQDVQAARDLLATVRPDAPETLAKDLDAVLLRLDLTLSNLPGFPVAASDDLDIAWQILLGGLPAQAAVTETPTPVLDFTPTPAEQVTSTPTPLVTIAPTATLVP